MIGDPTGFEDKRAGIVGTPHFVKAAKYSLGGLRRLLREQAFRDELICLAVILVLFVFAGAHVRSYFVQLLLFLILTSIEALNTAVEVLVDRVSPEVSSFAEQAKDLGSFAVFCLLCANGAYALLVISGIAT